MAIVSALAEDFVNSGSRSVATEDWTVALRGIAGLWEESAGWQMSDTLPVLEARLAGLENLAGVPDDVALFARQARLSVQGLDAGAADAGMLRQYIHGCLADLLVRAATVRLRPGNVANPQAPGVFLLDPRQHTAIASSIQLRAFGLNALSLLDGHELERALTRVTPVAFVLIADVADDPEHFREQALTWRSSVGSALAILLAPTDTLPWRRVAAQLDMDLFLSGHDANHQMGLHINAWIRQQRIADSVLLAGDPGGMQEQRRHWEALGVHVAVAGDLNAVWQALMVDSIDAVVVHPSLMALYPELPGLLRQRLPDQPVWLLEGVVTGGHDIMPLADGREACQQALLLLSRRRYQRLLRDEAACFGVESGLLTPEAFFDRALESLQRRNENDRIIACHIRFEGLEALLPVDDPVQRAFLRQNAAAALLARLSPGDLLAEAGDQNYLMLMRVGSERSFRSFSDSIAQVPLADGVILKVGMAPVMGMNLARAVKEAVGGLQVPTRQVVEVAPKLVSADWTSRLKAAIHEKRLFLAFQSIVNLEDDQQERYEVLLRLREDGVTLEPREFISTARQSGLIRYLDRWVVAEAIKTLRLRQSSVADAGLFIKVSGESLLDPSFLPWMQRVIATSGVSMTNSAIELEEEIFFTHVSEARDFVGKLQQSNVPVCISQFGRNDASLNLIEYCTPSYVKLHRQYSEQLGVDKAVDMRFADIIQRSHNAGIRLLVGYLESTQTLYRAVQNGAPLVQGHVLHRPSKVMEFDYSIVMNG